MNLFMLLGLIVLGAVAGYFSGLVGIGGGVIIVPALILFFGFSQYNAQGTTLAMLIPPIGILAVAKYYQKGHVDIKTALFLCIGFIIGGYLGSVTAVGLNEITLKRIFAAVLILLGIKMLLSSI
jgi:uncharacterized membrane protein YfcA